MYRLLLLILLYSSDSFSQSRDFIAVKKRNGITLKSFMAGSTIKFRTVSGKEINGFIQLIKNDSLWVSGYNIELFSAMPGVIMRDTVSAYVTRTHYKDIASIYLNRKNKRLPMLAGKVLAAGGLGYVALNSINHVLDGDTELYTRKDNYQRLARAGIAAVAGILLWKLSVKSGYSRKKHRIVYINLQ